MPIVFKERIYKIWKQFTTSRGTEPMPAVLCSKNEYTKSESNSQLCIELVWQKSHCVQRTNIQNLKAIHNQSIAYSSRAQLCSKNEYTKSESNSQRSPRQAYYYLDCVQRTNIQNLKAIHNTMDDWFKAGQIVFKERIYKIWKQFTTAAGKIVPNAKLCSKNEYTKSESNSQPAQAQENRTFIVFKERIYKIWKQFTTPRVSEPHGKILCSKNEYTKSESNSQRKNANVLHILNCVQRTNIQNLKAIHNRWRRTWA